MNKRTSGIKKSIMKHVNELPDKGIKMMVIKMLTELGRQWMNKMRTSTKKI